MVNKTSFETMLSLFELPDDIWRQVLVDWIPNIDDLSLLDIAMCSHPIRPRFLFLLKNFIPDPCKTTDIRDQQKLLQWTREKGMKLKELYLNLATWKCLLSLHNVALSSILPSIRRNKTDKHITRKLEVSSGYAKLKEFVTSVEVLHLIVESEDKQVYNQDETDQAFHTILSYMLNHQWQFPKVHTIRLTVKNTYCGALLQNLLCTTNFPVVTAIYIKGRQDALDYLLFQHYTESDYHGYHNEPPIFYPEEQDTIEKNVWKLPQSIQKLSFDRLDITIDNEYEFLCFLQHNHDSKLHHLEIENTLPGFVPLFAHAQHSLYHPSPFPIIDTITIAQFPFMYRMLCCVFSGTLQTAQFTDSTCFIVALWQNYISRTHPRPLFSRLQSLSLIDNSSLSSVLVTAEEHLDTYETFAVCINAICFPVLTHLKIVNLEGCLSVFYTSTEGVAEERTNLPPLKSLELVFPECSELYHLFSSRTFYPSKFGFVHLQSLRLESYPMAWSVWTSAWTQIMYLNEIEDIHLSLVIVQMAFFPGFGAMVPTSFSDDTKIVRNSLKKLKLFFKYTEKHNSSRRQEAIEERLAYHTQAFQFMQFVAFTYPNLNTFAAAGVRFMPATAIQYLYESLPQLRTLAITDMEIDSFPCAHSCFNSTPAKKDDIPIEGLVPSSNARSVSIFAAVNQNAVVPSLSRRFLCLDLKSIVVSASLLVEVAERLTTFMQVFGKSHVIRLHFVVHLALESDLTDFAKFQETIDKLQDLHQRKFISDNCCFEIESETIEFF